MHAWSDDVSEKLTHLCSVVILLDDLSVLISADHASSPLGEMIRPGTILPEVRSLDPIFVSYNRGLQDDFYAEAAAIR